MRNSQILNEDIELLARLSLWEKLSGKTLLITGATGMLGAYLALAANEANRIGGYGIKLLLSGRNEVKVKSLFGGVECQFLLQDIREPLTIDEPIHYFLHTAGPVGPTVFENNPAEVISVNVEGTLSILRYAIQHDCQSFVFASTHEVYGQVEGEQTESSPCRVIELTNPRACYVLAKQTAENTVACFAKQYGLRSASARFSRLYGPLMNLRSGLFVSDFFCDVLENRSVRVLGGLNLLRPLCYIMDAAEAMLHTLVAANAGEAYNVQGDELPTIGEIAGIVSSFGDCGTEFCHPETEDYAKTGHWLNTDKIKSLGWQPRVTLSDGLRRTFSYFNEAGVNT